MPWVRRVGLWLGAVAMLGMIVLGAARAWARPGPEPTPFGQLALDPLEGRGSVELVREGQTDNYRGQFRMVNEGQAPLSVTAVYVRHSPQDPRVPGTLAVALPGPLPKELKPGEQWPVTVTWNAAQARAQQIYGHVLVESTAPAPGGSEPGRPMAIGVHAERPLGLGFVGSHALSFLVFLPLLGLLAIFIAHLLGYKKDQNLRLLTVVLMGCNLALALWLWWKFDPGLLKIHGNDGFQFIEHAVWVRSLNAEYFLGVDGISISMVVLTALVSFVAAIASYSVQKQLKGYFAMFCLLVTGMMGTFVALDLILFFLFWEVMLLPMYFLIGIWGGPRRQYAAIKFFIYTLLGSVLMLLAFIYFYLNADPTYLVDGHSITRSLSIPELARVGWVSKGHVILGMSAVKVLWLAMFIAFAIKIPMFPFHTWLPDAHVEAPTAISVILAGVLLKMGTYGILRFNFTLLPEATRWAATTMAVFGVINILYGAFCAMAQTDLKKMVAYSSVSHMGYCLLGMAAMTDQGMAGAMMQMFNHGTITSMLFILVGVIYDRAHTRDINKFGGMATQMPRYAAFFGFAFMASLGLPGLSGFWGEILTFIGAFPRFRLLTVLAAMGVVVTAAYHLWALQRMFLGKFKEAWRNNEYLKPFGGRFPEINGREMLSLAPLALLVLVLGFYPRPLLRLLDRSSLQMHRWVDEPGPAQISQLSPSPTLALANHALRLAQAQPAARQARSD